MIRNAQIRFIENQSFENKNLTDVGSVVLVQNNDPSIPGQLKRTLNNEIVFVHPLYGNIIILDSTGQLNTNLNSRLELTETSSIVTITNDNPEPGLQTWEINHNQNRLVKSIVLLPDAWGNLEEVLISPRYPITDKYNKTIFIFNENMVGKNLLIVLF